VRFYKNAISRVILGKNFKKPLAIFVPKWYVVSNKSETWIHLHFGAANSAPHTPLFFTLLFSSFTFLSFTLPVPQGTRKAMTHLHGSSLFLLFIKSAARTAFPSVPHGLLYPQRVPLVLRQLRSDQNCLPDDLAQELAHKPGLVFGRQLLPVYVDMAAGGLFQKIHAAHRGGPA